MQIKEELKQICLNRIQAKIDETDSRISSLQKDLGSETKSSAGDKHETGRAMIQLEMEKESQKLKSFASMRSALYRMDLENQSELVRLGSLVKTSISNYFISASLGVLKAGHESYFAISLQSPIGQLLLGKKEGDSIHFNGREIQINSIS
ncbi:MAG: 3-oxoacyl-ACP synthase [Polaribacter sp.]